MIYPPIFCPKDAAEMQMSEFVELYSKLFIDFYVINIYNFKKRYEMGGSYEQELYYY